MAPSHNVEEPTRRALGYAYGVCDPPGGGSFLVPRSLSLSLIAVFCTRRDTAARSLPLSIRLPNQSFKAQSLSLFLWWAARQPPDNSAVMASGVPSSSAWAGASAGDVEVLGLKLSVKPMVFLTSTQRWEPVTLERLCTECMSSVRKVRMRRDFLSPVLTRTARGGPPRQEDPSMAANEESHSLDRTTKSVRFFDGEKYSEGMTVRNALQSRQWRFEAPVPPREGDPVKWSVCRLHIDGIPLTLDSFSPRPGTAGLEASVPKRLESRKKNASKLLNRRDVRGIIGWAVGHVCSLSFGGKHSARRRCPGKTRKVGRRLFCCTQAFGVQLCEKRKNRDGESGTFALDVWCCPWHSSGCR